LGVNAPHLPNVKEERPDEFPLSTQTIIHTGEKRMKTPQWTGLLILVLVVSFGCSQTEEPTAESVAESTDESSALEVAIDELSENLSVTEDPEKKAVLIREYLSQFPESEYTGEVLRAAIEPLVDELHRPEEAYDLFNEVMVQLTDPEIKLDAQKQLAVLHSKTGRLDELDALATAMEAEHDFQYTDYLDLMDTAVEAEAWELAIQQADASLALATPEAFRAQYDDISDEDVQRWGRRREAFSAAHKGWAQENLGQHEAALSTFADNADKTTYSFLGADDTPLRQNWGKSLIRQGEPERAMDVLEVEALYGSHEAKDAYKEAWVAAHGSEEGLEENLWSLRQEKSKALPQFALANYDGETIDTANFSGNVMLVVSWAPT